MAESNYSELIEVIADSLDAITRKDVETLNEKSDRYFTLLSKINDRINSKIQ